MLTFLRIHCSQRPTPTASKSLEALKSIEAALEHCNVVDPDDVNCIPPLFESTYKLGIFFHCYEQL